jgi:dihydrofolate synthase/folylpolyglutamate synthase
MAALLAPHFHTVIVSTPGRFKESNPEEVHALFRNVHSRVLLEKTPHRALEQAIRIAGKEKPILVTGSFYMLSEIRRIWLERPEKEAENV